MLIIEVSQTTGLTKKAITYYVEQNLISPAVLANGYRDFGETDIACLKKIAVLRRLGISTDQIRDVLTDKSGYILQKLAAEKKLKAQREQAKEALLDRLSGGENYETVAAALSGLEQSATIAERLLEAFPGYYGRLLCLHFAHFLDLPVATPEQQEAYRIVQSFLDALPPLSIPDDLQDYLADSAEQLRTQAITEMLDRVHTAYQDPDRFLAENKTSLDKYLAFKQSEEYQRSPFARLQALLRDFNKVSGYDAVFIPAMKILSPSYAAYHRQVELANERLLSYYPALSSPNE